MYSSLKKFRSGEKNKKNLCNARNVDHTKNSDDDVYNKVKCYKWNTIYLSASPLGLVYIVVCLGSHCTAYFLCCIQVSSFGLCEDGHAKTDTKIFEKVSSAASNTAIQALK